MSVVRLNENILRDLGILESAINGHTIEAMTQQYGLTWTRIRKIVVTTSKLVGYYCYQKLIIPFTVKFGNIPNLRSEQAWWVEAVALYKQHITALLPTATIEPARPLPVMHRRNREILYALLDGVSDEELGRRYNLKPNAARQSGLRLRMQVAKHVHKITHGQVKLGIDVPPRYLIDVPLWKSYIDAFVEEFSPKTT